MPDAPRSGRFFDAAWFLAWALLSSAWCVTAASQLSATFDEPIYVQRGLEHWRSGSTAGLMKLGTMPLPIDVETLPLYLWERWHGAPLDAVGRLDQLLPWARGFALVFWWLLLFYAWRAARSLGGPWAGRLAVALLACEPSFLAHASLATTDIAVCGCLLALAYHFRAGRDGPWLRRVGWPAAWFAVAVLAKASGLVFGGICMIVIEAERRLAPVWEGEAKGRWKEAWSALWRRPVRGTFRSDLTQIVLLGMAAVFVYCGSDWRPQASGLARAQGLPEGTGRTALVWFFEHACIFSNAGEGIVRQVTHNLRGAGVYILGKTDPRYLWYYFPVALSIKLTEPLLLAPALLLAVRPRSLRNWAALSALVLLLFSLNAHVQIGVRLVLPLVAFGVVGLAVAAAQTAGTRGSCGCHAFAALRGFFYSPRLDGPRKHDVADSMLSRPIQSGRTKRVEEGPRKHGTRQLLVAVSCAAAIAWMGAASWSAWPNGLCYVNHLWGDPSQGDRLLSDSNWDWGQGLKELARWQRRQGATDLEVCSFGADPTLGRLPLRPFPLAALPVARPEDVARLVKGRRLAVSATFVHGCLLNAAPPCALVAQQYIATQRPVARTSTFLIYDFR